MQARSSTDEIRRKFGLDFLPAGPLERFTGPTEQVAGSVPLFLENAAKAAEGTGDPAQLAQSVVLLRQTIWLLKTLEESSGQMRIYELVDRSVIEFDSLIRLVEQLNKAGLVTYLEKDTRGNHLVQLSEVGRSLLSLLSLPA